MTVKLLNNITISSKKIAMFNFGFVFGLFAPSWVLAITGVAAI
jgi:hypothetical protein